MEILIFAICFIVLVVPFMTAIFRSGGHDHD